MAVSGHPKTTSNVVRPWTTENQRSPEQGPPSLFPDTFYFTPFVIPGNPCLPRLTELIENPASPGISKRVPLSTDTPPTPVSGFVSTKLPCALTAAENAKTGRSGPNFCCRLISELVEGVRGMYQGTTSMDVQDVRDACCAASGDKRLCAQRGFRCGVEEKVLGPKAQLKLLSAQVIKPPALPLDIPSLPETLRPDDPLDVSRPLTFPLGTFLSAIPRSVADSVDEVMTFLDLKYLGLLSEIQLPNDLFPGTTSISLTREITDHALRNTMLMTMAIPWPEFPLSSKPFRYAALSFASSRLNLGSTSMDTFHYLSKFYKYAQEAIDTSSFIEVVVASYTILLYAYTTIQEPFETMLVYFTGMCEALAPLIRGRYEVSSHQRRSVEYLWRGALGALLRLYWSRVQPIPHLSDSEMMLVEKLNDVLQGAASLVWSRISSGESIADSSYQTLETLGHYLAFHLDYYLALRKRVNLGVTMVASASAETSLRQIIQQITQIVPQLPGSRELLDRAKHDSFYVWPELNCKWSQPSDILHAPSVELVTEFDFDANKAALLFGFAGLIHDIILTDISNMDDGPSVLSAGILLHLCVDIMTLPLPSPSGLSLTRYLFWVGVILTRTVDPAGKDRRKDQVADLLANNWILMAVNQRREIQNQRKPCSVEHTDKKFNTLFEVLGKASSGASIHDLLVSKSDEVDIFQCNRLLGKLYLASVLL